jgi:hypothetical protein
MQIGHKTAFARGGSTTMRNSVVLCYKHNKLQGTDSWPVFLKKMGKTLPGNEKKQELKGLPLRTLQFLAKKWGIVVKGTIEEGLFETIRSPPSKSKYIAALTKAAGGKDIDSDISTMPARAPRKQYKPRDSWW